MILDLFSFKKVGKEIFTKENFLEILELAKKEIIKQKDYIEKKGTEKKAAVIAAVTAKIEALKASCKNRYIGWCLDLLAGFIPTIVQFIYDCLKSEIENL